MSSERTEQLTALLDGRLNAEQTAELRAQMMREPELAELFEQLKAQSQMLQSLPRWKAPGGFARTVLDSVAALDPIQSGARRQATQGHEEHIPRIGFGWKRWIALAASISGVGLLLTFFLTNQANRNEIAKQEPAAPVANRSEELPAPNSTVDSDAGAGSSVTRDTIDATDPAGKLANSRDREVIGQSEDQKYSPPDSKLATRSISPNRSASESQNAPDSAPNDAPMPGIVASPRPNPSDDVNPASPKMKNLQLGGETNRAVAESDLGLIPEKGNSKPDMKLADEKIDEAKKLEMAGDSRSFGGGGGGLGGAVPGKPTETMPSSGNPASQPTDLERVAGESLRNLTKPSGDANNFVADEAVTEVWILDLPPIANAEGGDDAKNADKVVAKEARLELDCYLVTLASEEPPSELMKLQQSARVQSLTFADGFEQYRFKDALPAGAEDSAGKYKQSDEEAEEKAVQLTESYSRSSGDPPTFEPMVQRLGLDQTVLDRAFREVSESESNKLAEDRKDRGRRSQLPVPGAAASHNNDVQAGLEYLRRLSAQSKDLAARFDSNEMVPKDDLDRQSLSEKNRKLPAAGAGGLDSGDAAPQESFQSKEQVQLSGVSSRRILILFRPATLPTAPPSSAPPSSVDK